MCRHRLGDLRRREEKKKRIQRPGREGRRLDFCEEKKNKNDEFCSKEQRATSNCAAGACSLVLAGGGL
jgi:hypothetical protein